MDVPTFQELMLPTLQVLTSNGPLHIRDCATQVANSIQLPAEAREVMLPSGTETSIVNRTRWAAWHLQQAGLVRKPKRGIFEITEEGRQLLTRNPETIDLKLLNTYPSFVEKISKSGGGNGADKEERVPPSPLDNSGLKSTPDEQMEVASLQLRKALTTELREQLEKVDPFRFEQIVLDLLVKMGYGGSRKEAAEVTQKTNDEGIDGVINEDRLGLDVIYIQAKRWKSNIGRQEIQSFVGALAGKKASKGIFITTSDFNTNAREYAAGLHQKVILIDGQRLAELMIDYNIGVSEVRTYTIKRIDSDYFDANEM